jgi:hypothetical protein
VLYNLVCIVGSYICFCTVEGKYKKFGKSMFEKFKERKLYVSVGFNIVTGMPKCMIIVGCLK